MTLRSPIPRLAALALVRGVIALPWSTAPLGPDDDDEREERLVRREEGCQVVRRDSLMCHAEDMTTRPRLTTNSGHRSRQDGRLGAPRPPDRKRPLIDYLASHSRTRGPSRPPRRMTPIREPAARPPEARPSAPLGRPGRERALFATHCAVCHGPDARGGDLGTNLVEKPVLLRDKFRAPDTRRPEADARLRGRADEARQADLLAWLRRAR